MINTTPDEILNFWFADAIDSPEQAQAQSKRWFSQNDEFDQEIQKQFGELPEQIARGEFSDWRKQAEPALALVLALDQFPRNLYRGVCPGVQI